MMKKMLWTVLAVLILLGLCTAAGAEEIQVGQPFNVDIYLNEYVNARELQVSWREVKMAESSGFRFYEGAYATTDAGYQVQVRNGQTYLLSNGGFRAGKLCTFHIALQEARPGFDSLLLLTTVKNGYQTVSETPIMYSVKAGPVMPQLSVGSRIYFGAYEQDNNKNNGKEQLVWRVLALNGNQALVIADQVIDQRAYHTAQTAVTWETSRMRQWLNGEFYNNAFTPYEQGKVVQALVPGHQSPYYNTDSSRLSVGNDTWDKVFLLSAQEANQYFSSNQDRVAYPTQYLVAKDGALESVTEPADWLLRQPHKHRTNTACVSVKGATSNGVNVTHALSGLRPAMWLQLP